MRIEYHKQGLDVTLKGHTGKMFINKEANTCLLSCIDQTLIENVGNVAFSKY